jgi:alkylated DNA repair dioxygenase AlkB
MRKRAAKRELISPRGDKRYIRRDARVELVKATMSAVRSPRTAAGRPRRRRNRDRATVATANHRRLRPGNNRVPGDRQTLDLFAAEILPQGFRYQSDFLSREEETALLQRIESLSFREFEFRGFTGRRRIVSFGWRYDFNGGGLAKTEDMPKFLFSVRARSESFAGLAPGELQQVLITEYSPGAAIGWHKDRSVFGDVLGILLLSPCTFRLRLKTGKHWEPRNLTAEPPVDTPAARILAQRLGAQHFRR